MTCQVIKPEVNYYKASILVTNQYGRSLASPNTFFVAPDENVYNFQTYAGNFNKKLASINIFNS